jgi:hypothetical protein
MDVTKMKKHDINLFITVNMHTICMKINNKLQKYIIILLIITALTAVLGGCMKGEEIPEINLPSTSVLSIQSTWAVVTSTHLRLRENPSTESSAVATLWKGNVLEILTRSDKKEIVEDERDFWYQIKFGGLTGWVFGAYLDVHSSREKAEEAAQEIK